MLCFGNIPLANRFLDKKGGEYQEFPSKNFCLTVPKNFVREPFCDVFQKISGSRKAFVKDGGREFQEFLSKVFCLTVPKKFVGEPFRMSLIRVSKNFMLKRVMSRFFVKFLLSRSTKNLWKGTRLCCVSQSFR